MPFGLRIDPIEAEDVLIVDAIDAAVTGLPKLLRRIQTRAAIAHGHREFDDQLLEESWAIQWNPTQDQRN